MLKTLRTTFCFLCLLIAGVSSAWGDDTFSRVTSTSDLEIGGKYLIVYESGKKAMGVINSSKHGEGVTVTISSNTITLPSTSTANVLTLGGTTDAYTLLGSQDNKYIGWASKTDLASSESASDNKYQWKITFSSNNVLIKSVSDNSRMIRFYGDNSDFRAYTSSNGLAVQLYKKEITFTLTGVSSNAEYGTVAVSGNKITATPKAGYIINKTTPYTITSGEDKVTNVSRSGNVFTVTATGDCTVQINFEAIPTHTATFHINGATQNNTFGEGNDVVFPEVSDIAGKTLVGWVATPIDGTTDTAPAGLSSSYKMGTVDTDYYAVFAKEDVGAAETATLTANESWSSYRDKTFTDDQSNTWSANCSGSQIGGDYYNYGLNGGTSYLESPTFNGNVTEIKITATNGSGSADRTFYIKSTKNGATGDLGEIAVAKSTTNRELTASLTGTPFKKFFMTSSAALQFSSISVTYLPIAYSGYCTSIVETVTISAAGLATYASDYALDYTDVDGIEAYIAKEETGTVKLHQVKKVPAGTGVLLRSTNSGTSYEVPITTAATDNVDGNAFVRGTGAYVESGSGPYNYILNIVNEVLGFYKANGNMVAKNRAYLQTNVTSARIALNFDDETTGIKSMDNGQLTMDNVYDMQGRKVKAPKKGLYIINGRKVVIK